MAKKRRQTLVVEILVDWPVGTRQAQDKLHHWLETFGYTASSHGFAFVNVGVLTGKRLSKAPSLSNNREQKNDEDASPPEAH
jgi:hypothetical protein